MPGGEAFCVLIAGLFAVSVLYSSVGHGGASGYLAIMTLLSVAPQRAGTTALFLNILVAGLAWWTYGRAGHFSFSLLAWFTLGSIPASLAGGWIRFSDPVLYAFFAVTLGAAALVMLLPRARSGDPAEDRRVAPGIPVAIGAALGFVSGVVGVGGGIFLSPLMALTRWSTMKRIAATSAAFIVVNSVAGLVGRLRSGVGDLTDLVPLGLTVAVGGSIGSWIGARRMTPPALRFALGVVMLVAAGKMALLAFRPSGA
jgi:uncharacterized membrane protein YfcA